MVTTIDLMAREPIGVAELVQVTGLGRYVRAIDLKAGYNWFLLGILANRPRGASASPATISAFSGTGSGGPIRGFLVTRLLRLAAGLMDDLHFRPRVHPGWKTHSADVGGRE